MKALKTIRSYAGHARFLAETEGTTLEAPSVAFPKQPYRYSPTVDVMLWNGRQVVCLETSHRVYQVFAIPADVAVTERIDA